jgi:hypothetical protein
MEKVMISRNVTINIERYSAPEERQVLVDAFQQAGSEGLFNALEKNEFQGTNCNYWHTGLRH